MVRGGDSSLTGSHRRAGRAPREREPPQDASHDLSAAEIHELTSGKSTYARARDRSAAAMDGRINLSMISAVPQVDESFEPNTTGRSVTFGGGGGGGGALGLETTSFAKSRDDEFLGANRSILTQMKIPVAMTVRLCYSSGCCSWYCRWCCSWCCF